MSVDGQASDGDLLRATRTGDGAAFAMFYRRHLPRVMAFLLRETGDREASADLAATEPESLDDADLARVDELASGPGVLALVDELPPRQRAAITARIVQEREYPEIAAQLECSEMVVRQQVSRGLTRLRGRLQEGPQ